MLMEALKGPTPGRVRPPRWPLWVEGIQLLGRSKPSEMVENLKADTLMRRSQRHNLVDMILCGPGRSLYLW